jgi:hypothetical protein
MLKQIIKGEKEVSLKFHGKVKFMVFECNQCHKDFEKPASYYRKQMKTRKNSCCFCSPQCRVKYLKVAKPISSKDIVSEPVSKVVTSSLQVKQKGFFSAIKDLFSS